MSARYTDRDLQGLGKEALIQIVSQNLATTPGCEWPAKVCTYRSLSKMTVKHLKKAITGPHGFVKLSESGKGLQEEKEEGNLMDKRGVNHQGDEGVQEDGSHGALAANDTELVMSVEAVSLAEAPAHGAVGAFMLGPLEEGTPAGDPFVSPAVEVDFSPEAPPHQTVAWEEGAIPGEPFILKDVTSPSEQQLPRTPIASSPESGAQAPSHNHGVEEPKAVSLDTPTTGVYPQAPTKAEAPLVIIQAEVNSNLLSTFVSADKDLSKLLSTLQQIKRKRQPDSVLVNCYENAVHVYNTLWLKTDWPNLTGRISGREVLNFMQISHTWLSNARAVLSLLEEVGPKAKNPDAQVVKRLQSNEVTKKGIDLPTFLKNRVQARKDE